MTVPDDFNKGTYIDSVKAMHEYLTTSAAHWDGQEKNLTALAADAATRRDLVKITIDDLNAVLALET